MIEYSEYEGHPMMTIVMGEYKGEKRGIKFGVKKAQAILDNLPAIEKFIEDNTKPAQRSPYDDEAPF